MRPDENEPPEPHEPAPNAEDPGVTPAGPPPGIFERSNNYLLLVYAGACLLMDYSLAALLYIEGMVSLSLSLPGILAIIIPFFLLAQRSALGFSRQFSLGRITPGAGALALLVSAAAILPVDAFSTIFERMWAPDADYISFILSIKPKGPVSFFFVAIGIVGVAAIAEELLFRGFIQRIFQRNMNGALAVVLAGLIFALCHFNLPALPGVAALGVLYGYLFYRTGALWYSIIGHGVYNLVTLLRLNAATEEEIVSTSVTSPDLGWTLVSLGVLLASLALLARIHPKRQ